MSTQLQSLYITLSASEQKRFLDFLDSPLHNRREDVRKLASSMGFKEAEKEKAFAAIYPQEAYQDVRWRQLKSHLLTLLEEFLVYLEKEAGLAMERELTLQKTLRSRRQPLRYAAATRRLERKKRDAPEGYRRARLDFEADWENAQDMIDQRQLDLATIESVRRTHERSFLIESLRLACHALSTQTIRPGELDQQLLRQNLALIAPPQQLEEDSTLALYCYCYRMLEAPEEKGAFAAFLTLLPHLDTLDAEEARDLTLMSVNYCIGRVNRGDAAAGITALDLYDRGFEKGYLLDRERISRFTFSNVIALALKADAPARAANFIDRLGDLLPPAYQQSTLALNRARLAYAQGQLGRASDELRSATDQEVITTLNIKILQMRVYYQLREYRLLDAHLDALEIYLRRRKDSLGYHYKAYRQLVGFVRKFRKLNEYAPQEVANFRKSVEAAGRFPERDWVMSLLPIE